jgi:two-component system response regulator YesN
MWKVAIIDDDPNVLRGMKKIIPWEELELEWVGEGKDGEEGLELIRLKHPDIVITDVYMPVLSGLDMVEKLRREGFKGKIIVLSGYSDFEYARQAMRLSVDDYLLKPASVTSLRQVIERVIGQLEEELIKKVKLDEVYQKLLSYEPFIAKEWMKSIVEGTFKKNMYHERFIHLQSDAWLNGKHLVLGIEIARNQRVSQSSISDWNLLRFAVGNIVNEVMQKESPESQFVQLQTRIGMIVLHCRKEENQEMIQQRVNKLLEEVLYCVEKNLKINILIGIGTVKDHWQQIYESTNEAYLAINTQSAEDNPDLSEIQLKFYHNFALAIRNSQAIYAQELVDSYIGHLNEYNQATPAILQQNAIELWTILVYTLYFEGIEVDDIYPKLILQNDLTEITSNNQFGLWLTKKIELILESHNYKENIKHKKTADKIIEYIHEHYSEEITLEELAEIVLISRNYLCFIFKKVTGETFNQYLTRVRIEKAKEMILEGKWLIYEIAEKVGYKNIPYFSTLFKKITGNTPSALVKQ